MASKDDGVVITFPGVRVERAPGEPRTDWQPTHKHLKTGGLYRKLMTGTLEADMTQVVIYQNGAGRIWVRPQAEFDDWTRFVPLNQEDGGPESA